MMAIIREQSGVIPKVGTDIHWGHFDVFPTKETNLAGLGGT